MSGEKTLKTGIAFGFVFTRLRNITGVHTFLSIILTTSSFFQSSQSQNRPKFLNFI